MIKAIESYSVTNPNGNGFVIVQTHDKRRIVQPFNVEQVPILTSILECENSKNKYSTAVDKLFCIADRDAYPITFSKCLDIQSQQGCQVEHKRDIRIVPIAKRIKSIGQWSSLFQIIGEVMYCPYRNKYYIFPFSKALTLDQYTMHDLSFHRNKLYGSHNCSVFDTFLVAKRSIVKRLENFVQQFQSNAVGVGQLVSY